MGHMKVLRQMESFVWFIGTERRRELKDDLVSFSSAL